MLYVIDASVASAWAFADEETPASLDYLKRAQAQGLIAPQLFVYEMGNVLLMNQRKNRIQKDAAGAFLHELYTLVAIEHDRAHEVIYAVAVQYGLTFYDAAYLELAQRHRMALMTFDKKLVDAARSAGIEVIA